MNAQWYYDVFANDCLGYIRTVRKCIETQLDRTFLQTSILQETKEGKNFEFPCDMYELIISFLNISAEPFPLIYPTDPQENRILNGWYFYVEQGGKCVFHGHLGKSTPRSFVPRDLDYAIGLNCTLDLIPPGGRKLFTVLAKRDPSGLYIGDDYWGIATDQEAQLTFRFTGQDSNDLILPVPIWAK